MWSSFIPCSIRWRRNRWNNKYDFPHLRIPVITFTIRFPRLLSKRVMYSERLTSFMLYWKFLQRYAFFFNKANKSCFFCQNNHTISKIAFFWKHLGVYFFQDKTVKIAQAVLTVLSVAKNLLLVYSKKLNIRTQINPFQIKVHLIEPTCHESLFAECDLQYIT